MRQQEQEEKKKEKRVTNNNVNNDATNNPRKKSNQPNVNISSSSSSTSASSTSVSNVQNSNTPSETTSPSIPLTFLCLSKSWVAATNRALSHPQEAQYGCTSSARSLLPLDDNGENSSRNVSVSNSFPSNNTSMASSPLALVTRYGAPSYCIKAVLDAEKRMVRHCIPNRGTPLHEAIMVFPTCSNGNGNGGSNSTNTSNDNGESQMENGNGIVQDQITEYVKIIRMLIKADEALEKEELEGSVLLSNSFRKLLMLANLDSF
jgi:hypothetical protein